MAPPDFSPSVARLEWLSQRIEILENASAQQSSLTPTQRQALRDELSWRQEELANLCSPPDASAHSSPNAAEDAS